MKPPQIPANYVQTAEGVWEHPSRVRLFGKMPDPNQLPLSQGIKQLAGFSVKQPKRIRQSSKPLLNKTECRWLEILTSRGVVGVMAQAITLRLDPPFQSYRPDLAYLGASGLTFVECKGPHRFREKGIAKAALAAKTYPQFRFELVEWTGSEWKESVLSS